MIRVNKKKETSDDELLALFITNQDMEAFGRLFDRLLPLVYGVCIKYLKNREEAKDETMAIYELCLEKLPGQEINSFKSWLYRVTVNHCLMKLRKKNQQFVSDIDMELNIPEHPIEESTEIYENLNFIAPCLELLKETQKICVSMFFLKQMSYLEIQDKTGFTYNEVKSNIQNGKRNLKICLEESIKSDE